MKCVSCGAVLRRESMFCLSCGAAVNSKDCYVKELIDCGKSLTRQTDIDSLNRIIELTEKIYDRAEINEGLRFESRDIFEHYLPMITRVVRMYKSSNKEKIDAKTIKEVRDDLTEVLDTTERAFEIFMEELYAKDIEELQTNIEVLKNKIARDGMVDSDFEITE